MFTVAPNGDGVVVGLLGQFVEVAQGEGVAGLDEDPARVRAFDFNRGEADLGGAIGDRRAGSRCVAGNEDNSSALLWGDLAVGLTGASLVERLYHFRTVE